jgi:hypothetical protein
MSAPWTGIGVVERGLRDELCGLQWRGMRWMERVLDF